MKVRNKVWVITGGGSGMGRELALLLLKKGARVAIVDIKESSMQETAELAGETRSHLSTHLLNITDKTRVFNLPKQVIEVHGAVDGLINNAGIIQPFIKVNELAFEAIERVMQVNFYGTLYMVKAFLPYLLERPEAHIANISSMGGFVPVPGQTFYGASKAAVKLLTEGLFSELQDTSVQVSAVFPGAVETNITSNSGVDVPGAGAEAESSFQALPADRAAEIIINGIEKNKFHILVGKDARFMHFLSRLAPKRAAKLIYKQMQTLLD
ncbi:MAG TPA: SDR family NAD(P)-dependent oxidoreductase [Saprospiraceae bacterium]|nr:SDR family NAD(P)-dependent oxidoreductase [Saprospiraceae bacterium]